MSRDSSTAAVSNGGTEINFVLVHRPPTTSRWPEALRVVAGRHLLLLTDKDTPGLGSGGAGQVAQLHCPDRQTM